VAILSADQVVKRLENVEPEPLRTHVVRVAGRLYPVKQAYAAVSGHDRLDFNTVTARRFFKALGFDVIRLG